MQRYSPYLARTYHLVDVAQSGGIFAAITSRSVSGRSVAQSGCERILLLGVHSFSGIVRRILAISVPTRRSCRHARTYLPVCRKVMFASSYDLEIGGRNGQVCVVLVGPVEKLVTYILRARPLRKPRVRGLRSRRTRLGLIYCARVPGRSGLSWQICLASVRVVRGRL